MLCVSSPDLFSYKAQGLIYGIFCAGAAHVSAACVLLQPLGVCPRAKYRLSLVHSEFSFKFLDRIGPLDRLSRLITVSDEHQHCLLEIRRTGEMIGLKELASQHAEPDFELIQPGGICWQPMHLERQPPLLLKRLLLQPAPHLLGRVRRAIIQHQCDSLDTPPPRLWHQHLRKQRLESPQTVCAWHTAK